MILPRLGKKAARHDPRTLKLTDYVDRPALPEIPKSTRYGQAVKQWPLLGNDAIGCCAIASPAHLYINWTANDAPRVFAPTDEDVEHEYQIVGGYVPGDPSTDGGCVMLDVLNRWRRVGLFGRAIGAFASINPDDIELVQAAIYLFGGVLTGFSLPMAVAGKKEWRAPNRRARRFGQWRPGSWGGHAVCITDYDDHDLTAVSWGNPLKISYSFQEAYCDELYAVIGPEWLGDDNKAPNGFDGAALAKDIVALGAQ